MYFEYFPYPVPLVALPQITCCTFFIQSSIFLLVLQTYVHVSLHNSCSYAYVHTYVHAYRHTIYICTCVHMYIHMYVCAYNNIYVHTYIRTYVVYILLYVHMYVHVCIPVTLPPEYKLPLLFSFLTYPGHPHTEHKYVRTYVHIHTIQYSPSSIFVLA